MSWHWLLENIDVLNLKLSIQSSSFFTPDMYLTTSSESPTPASKAYFEVGYEITFFTIYSICWFDHTIILIELLTLLL